MDATPKTREQFRERLLIQAEHLIRASRHKNKIAPSDLLHIAEASYELALRDVLSLMREREIVVGEFVVTVPTVTDDDVVNYAAQRGIDMEDH